MSDQADKATEKKRQAVRSILGLYGRIARHYCPANSVVDAGVAILDELIRSAAPSSALVDAANKAIDSSHSDNPQDWLDAIDALRAALSAQEPKVLVGCEKIADAIITFRCETSQEPFNGVEFKDFIMEQLSRPTLLRCALALVAEEFDSMKWWECYDALRAALTIEDGDK